MTTQVSSFYAFFGPCIAYKQAHAGSSDRRNWPLSVPSHRTGSQSNNPSSLGPGFFRPFFSWRLSKVHCETLCPAQFPKLHDVVTMPQDWPQFRGHVSLLHGYPYCRGEECIWETCYPRHGSPKGLKTCSKPSIRYSNRTQLRPREEWGAAYLILNHNPMNMSPKKQHEIHHSPHNRNKWYTIWSILVWFRPNFYILEIWVAPDTGKLVFTKFTQVTPMRFNLFQTWVILPFFQGSAMFPESSNGRFAPMPRHRNCKLQG